MERCPHCKAPIYGDLPWTFIDFRFFNKETGVELWMPKREASVLAKFLKVYPNHVTTDSMVYMLWAEEGREEPVCAENACKIYFSRVRKIIRPLGMDIKRVAHRSFALEKING